jgi:WS/DGAT/MGAT family acyltransferase
MKQLGYTDSIFITLETPTTPQHIGFLGVYDPSTTKDGIVRFKEVLANFDRRLHTLPTFRMRVEQVPGRLDRPYWVEDADFDVEYHIRHLALPKPGDWRQLCIQVARLHARSLDMKRPLWECSIIEGLNNVEGCAPGGFAVYVKIHHSLVDGDLGQQIMALLHDMEPYPPAEEYEEESGEEIAKEFRRPRFGDSELVARAFTSRIRNTLNLTYAKNAKAVVSGVGGTLVKMAKGELSPPLLGPKTRFDEPVGLHRVFDSAEFSLPEMKKIKNSSNTSVNDVCVSVVGGALRKYLKYHGELPEESVVANIPVNMRKRGGSSDDNNQIASLMAQVHTEIADPIERLVAVHDSVDEAKNLIGTPLSEPLKIVALLPPFLGKPFAQMYAAEKLTNFIPAGSSTVITNVPGPPIDLYCNGAKLVKMNGLGLLTPGVALFNTVFSFGDNISISVLADRDLLPDPAFYRQCLEESYAELRDAVLG